MQYNSYFFILLFLPFFLAAYYIAGLISQKSGRMLIIIFSLAFYSFAGMKSFVVLMVSAATNYVLSFLIRKADSRAKALLIITLSANVGFLLYCKYLGTMPLGISFFTFQQIMYVVNVYRKDIDEINFLDYTAYIMYFPKLIMGPIVEPGDLISRINDPDLKKVNWDNIACGLKLFSFGLFKKLVFADTFARGVECGFGNIASTTAMDMILVMLFYSFEIYFDFSGYIDMATGVSKMINIELPINFDSPYKSVSIRDFWKRWHVSLTRFFTKYIYYPLGGNRKGTIRTYVNIMIVFLASGIWHGANYTFILWGFFHGLLQIVERAAGRFFDRLPGIVRYIYTFAAVNVLWLLFRSSSISEWRYIIKKIIQFRDISVSTGLMDSFLLPEMSLIYRMFHLTAVADRVRCLSMVLFSVSALLICLIPENNYRSQMKKNVVNMLLAAAAFVWGFLCLGSESVFVYYNF